MIKLNVIKLLEEKGKSKYWLFNKLNDIGTISYTNFNNLVEQKNKSIKYESIDKLCEILECEPQNLFSRVDNQEE